MRIAHVTSRYVPEDQGGSAQQVRRLAVEQHRRGHRVAVFSGLLAPGRRMLETTTGLQDGFPVTRIVTTDGFREEDERNWRNAGVEPAFQDFLREHVPEVVHCHSLQSLGGSLIPIAKLAGTRVVVTMPDLWWVCERRLCVDVTSQPCIPAVTPGSCACLRGTDALFDRRAYLEKVLADVDLVLAPSRTLVERLRMSGVGGRIEVDASAVPVAPDSGCPAPPSPQKRGLSRSDAPLRLLYVGGEATGQGIHVLDEALRRLQETGVRVEADLYGVDAPSLQLTARLARTGARVHASLEPGILDQVMSSHDLLVMPSVMSAPSAHALRAVRVAVARGLPVVAALVTGPREVVADGVNGLLVPPGDPVALAGAIRCLDRDRALLVRLRGAGPQGGVTTSERQAGQVEGLYRSIDRGRLRAARPPAPRRVLFVSGADGSALLRYRVHQKMEQLRIHGTDSVLLLYADPDLERALDDVDAVIVYRAPATRELLRFIREVHRRRLPIRFDVDDLVFDPEMAEGLPSIAHLPREERLAWIEGVRRHRATLLECGAGIASTAEIARQMRKLGVAAAVHRNGVDTALAVVSEGARRARGSRLRGEGGPFVLGYASGTDTHDADLALVAPALVDFLRDHPEARLILCGLLQPPASLDRVAGQVRRVGLVSWHRHPTRLATFDLNLAPLIDGVFSESKSSIKWSEAALLDVPTLASATAPFRESIEHGETGMLASTVGEWREMLEEAIAQPENLARMGRKARLSAYRQGSPWTLGDNLLHILAEPLPDRHGDSTGGGNGWPSEVGRRSVEPAGLLTGLQVSPETLRTAPGPSLFRHRVAFDLPTWAGPLARVDVYLTTLARQVAAPVSLEVRSSAGEMLDRAELQPEAISDSGWAAFEVTAPGAEPAVAELSSPLGGKVWPYMHVRGFHYLDGRRRVGGIVARTFHRPPVPPDFGAAVPDGGTGQPRWVLVGALLAIAGRRAVFILRTEGPIDGFRRVAGGVRRRLRRPRRRR